MLYANGIINRQMKAGSASVASSKSTFKIEPIIKNPTTIKAGAVAKDGIAKKIGDNNNATRNNAADTNAVSPVLPP